MRKKPSNLPMLVSLTLVLFILGVLGLLIINANQLSDHLKENVLVMVYFNKSAPEHKIKEAISQIDFLEEVKRTKYISKEEAAYSFKEELGEDFVEVLGNNPLPASLEVFLKSNLNEQEIKRVLSDLSELDYVYEVDHDSQLLQDIEEKKQLFGAALFLLSVIFIIVSIVLINNTVRLAVYSKRFLVKSMQLVGASEWFIIKPFMLRSFIVGVLGALIAFALNVALMIGVYKWLGKNGLSLGEGNVQNYLEFFDFRNYSFLFVSLLVLGMIIVLSSTYFSTKRYLKLKIEDLY